LQIYFQHVKLHFADLQIYFQHVKLHFADLQIYFRQVKPYFANLRTSSGDRKRLQTMVQITKFNPGYLRNEEHFNFLTDFNTACNPGIPLPGESGSTAALLIFRKMLLFSKIVQKKHCNRNEKKLFLRGQNLNE
jgi:hypothetical protein